MSTKVMTTITKWQDETLKLMHRVEEPVLSFTTKATERVEPRIPERPQWSFLEEMPTVTEFVESQLKFRRKMIDEQASFVHKMLKAMHPALVKFEGKTPAHKAAAKTAPKAAAA